MTKRLLRGFHSGRLVSSYDLPWVRSRELQTVSAANLRSSWTQIPLFSSTSHQMGITALLLVSLNWNECLGMGTMRDLSRELVLTGCCAGGYDLIAWVWGRSMQFVNFFKLLSGIWVTYALSLITTLEMRRTSIVRWERVRWLYG